SCRAQDEREARRPHRQRSPAEPARTPNAIMKRPGRNMAVSASSRGWVQTRESLEIPDVGCLPHPPLSALASGDARIAADMIGTSPRARTSPGSPERPALRGYMLVHPPTHGPGKVEVLAFVMR